MLIGVVTYDTEENNRSWMTVETLESLFWSVDRSRHRIIVSDNGSCSRTTHYLKLNEGKLDGVLWNGENLGTAKAFNKIIRLRRPGEAVCKVDNDMRFRETGWADLIELVFERANAIGIVGAKLKMLEDAPDHANPFYRTELHLLPHVAGEKWHVVEIANHIPGACQAYSSALLDKVGGLFQFGKYGWDDVIMCVRSRRAGFLNAFLHIDVDHIDPCDDAYSASKRAMAAITQPEVAKLFEEYDSGKRSLYVEP